MAASEVVATKIGNRFKELRLEAGIKGLTCDKVQTLIGLLDKKLQPDNVAKLRHRRGPKIIKTGDAIDISDLENKGNQMADLLESLKPRLEEVHALAMTITAKQGDLRWEPSHLQGAIVAVINLDMQLSPYVWSIFMARLVGEKFDLVNPLPAIDLLRTDSTAKRQGSLGI